MKSYRAGLAVRFLLGRHRGGGSRRAHVRYRGEGQTVRHTTQRLYEIDERELLASLLCGEESSPSMAQRVFCRGWEGREQGHGGGEAPNLALHDVHNNHTALDERKRHL